MEGFKKGPKIACFKEGGSTGYKSRKEHSETKEMSEDIKQDKAIVKKAFTMHDKQKHEGKTDLSKLCGGGRAKTGGKVKRYAGGKAVMGPGRQMGPMGQAKEAAPLGVGQPSGAMGVAAPGRKFQPGRSPEPRVGYCGGGMAKKKGKYCLSNLKHNKVQCTLQPLVNQL